MRTTSSCDGVPIAKRPVRISLAALAVVGLLGACSGGNDDSAGSDHDLSSVQEAEFETELEFARCMRGQGIEGFPDPQVSESGLMVVGIPWEADQEQWQAAADACHPDLDEPAPGEAAAAGWEEVVPGGDCQCSDGSEFNFWVREASPEKVVVFLEGGGACFSAETCAPDNEVYHTAITEGPDREGIFDVADERNPFADYSFVFVPYCTGDVHLGNATTDYGSGLSIQHKGFVNGTAALDHLGATFPDATDVVVMGESAGSVAAPLYGGLVSDRLPDAAITVLADGSGSYPDLPAVNELVSTAWGIDNAGPAWFDDAGFSLPGLFIQSGRHDPDIVFARHDFAYDENQTSWYPYLGIPAGDLRERIDANEAQIENAGVNLRSYIAPGEKHTVLGDAELYTEEVDAQRLVDWVTRLVEGEPVNDVHCDECAPS